MKRTGSVFFIVLTFMLFIGVVIFISRCRNISGELPNSRDKDSIQICKINVDMNNKLTGSLLPTSMFISDSVLLKRNKPIFVFRISEQQCDMCIDHEMFIIKEMLHEMRDRIVVIGSFSMIENYKWRIISDTYLSIPLDSFPLKTETYNKPYYFVLDSNLRISNIFISDIEYETLTRDYLQGIEGILSE